MDTENTASSVNTVSSQHTSFQKEENKNCCGICIADYKSPRILPCKHIFCRFCLIQLADKDVDFDFDEVPSTVEELDPLKCPLCREETDLSNGGVDNLPMYFQDDDEDEDNDGKAGNDDAGDDDDDQRDLCVVCENSVPAVFECFQCQKMLCTSCKKNHDTWLQHEVKDLKLDLTQDKCVNHPEVKVGYFCLDCDKIICKECVKSEHSLHQTQTLKSYLMEIDGELKDYSSKIEKEVETVEMSKIMFFSKTEFKVLTNIENVKIHGEDLKVELEKACRWENRNQHANKTLLSRIHFIGRKIQEGKKQRTFSQNLISEIKELQARITTHKIFYLPYNVDDIINNQIGMMDIQIGRLFEFQLRDDGLGEFKFFYGNLNWSLSARISMDEFFEEKDRADACFMHIVLTPFRKPEDNQLIGSITTTVTLYVEREEEDSMSLRKFSKKFQSEKDHINWKCYNHGKSVSFVKVLFQNTNIKHRTQAE